MLELLDFIILFLYLVFFNFKLDNGEFDFELLFLVIFEFFLFKFFLLVELFCNG